MLRKTLTWTLLGIAFLWLLSSSLLQHSGLGICTHHTRPSSLCLLILEKNLSVHPTLCPSIHLSVYLDMVSCFQQKEKWIDGEIDAVGLNNGYTSSCPFLASMCLCRLEMPKRLFLNLRIICITNDLAQVTPSAVAVGWNHCLTEPRLRGRPSFLPRRISC